MIRLSIDTKATIKIGPYSRGGYNRHGVRAADHDFQPEAIIKLFGIFIPQIDENHFLLDSIGKVIGLAKTMKWTGKIPFVKLINGIYKTGVRLTKSAMKKYENMLKRKTDLEKWFVDIFCFDRRWLV